jgi:hypothetical protein
MTLMQLNDWPYGDRIAGIEDTIGKTRWIVAAKP